MQTVSPESVGLSLTRLERIGPAEELNCLIMLQYMSCFTIPIVEDFAQQVWQALE